MTAKLAEVKTLYQSNARQIPEMMRELASDIDDPPVPDTRPDQAVCVIRDSKTGQLNVYGWGDVNIAESIGILAFASSRLCEVGFGGDLWKIATGGVSPKE